MSSLGPPPGNTVDVAQTVAVAETVIRVLGEVDNGGVTVRFVEVVAVLVENVAAAKILAIAIVAGVV